MDTPPPPIVKTTPKSKNSASAVTYTIISLALAAVCGGMAYFVIRGFVRQQRSERAQREYLRQREQEEESGSGNGISGDTAVDPRSREDLMIGEYENGDGEEIYELERMQGHGGMGFADREGGEVHENEEIRRHGESLEMASEHGQGSDMHSVSRESISAIPVDQNAVLRRYLERDDLGLMQAPRSMQLQDQTLRRGSQHEDGPPPYEIAMATTAAARRSSSSSHTRGLGPAHQTTEHQDQSQTITIRPPQHRASSAEVEAWREREHASLERALSGGRRTL